MNKFVLAAFVLICAAAQAHSESILVGAAEHQPRFRAENSSEATNVRAQILLAQATPRQPTQSNAPNSALTVVPNAAPSATANTTATCVAGCTSQFFACSGPCQSTLAGTTIVPSQTSAGITNSPGLCVQNCSTQQQTCQRNCSFQ